MALSLSANAAELEVAAGQVSAAGSVDSGAEVAKASSDSNVYIVRLADDAVASYMGGTAGLAATSNRATGATVLNTNSEASQNYASYLRKGQAEFIAECEAAFGHKINVKFDYQHVFNGVAIELSADEAKAIAAQPSVKSVSRERMEVPLTDNGPRWIKANHVWNNTRGFGHGTRGEGMVVAVLDTGINSDHPSYADIGGDGYDHTNPLGSGNYLPGSWCDTTEPAFCNDKLIGAWSFVPGDVNFPSPEDSDGHGSHTSGTAAGNVVRRATLFAPTTELVRNISGVAPHANIIMYDVCVVNCPGSALLAAINQVVIDAAALPDGIHSLNYSISGGGDPWNDPVELGFLNATAAGVYVAASAGNSGPGASTVAHLGPWVSTTASLTHDRVIENSVVNMTSDGGSLPDIAGVGLTSGYGPATIINSADLEGAFPGSTLCGLGGLGSFIPPWPPGTFSGEIVACTRGTFGRVEKGANALAAGAGGYILMDNGAGIVADAHVLPAAHITQADGAVLAAWLAANANTEGSITDYSLFNVKANGDIMAGTSSRGPGNINVIKPDLGAPGVAIFAAEADGQAPAPEYQIISGTSMASPHNAGSGALLSALYPDWTPYQIKSALMMTADTKNTLKEDGSTRTDHFDLGAGRINLEKARRSNLLLDETPVDFLLADPDLGGDPGTLNLASMMNDSCVGSCSWTRTFDNALGYTGHWRLRTKGPSGLGLSTSPRKWLEIHGGDDGSVTVTANTALAPPGWNFANLTLNSLEPGPTLHLPIAVFAAQSSNADLLSKTVDAATAAEGEPLNYEISIVNGQLTGQIDMEDEVPDGLSLVPGSVASVVTNGSTISLGGAGGVVSWSGTLDQGGLQVNPGLAPFGYFSLASLGVAPFGCPSDCDDGGFILNVPSFTFNGASYSQVIWSVNGTLEAGTASGQTTSFFNQNLPDAAPPNNIMAPLWTDLNLGDGGEWYVGVLNAGPDQFTVYEWEDVPRFGNPTSFTFQIWILNTGAGGIWYVYDRIDNLAINGTVGVENDSGTLGESQWRNGTGTPPAVGTDLQVVSTQGGTATISFQAEIDECRTGDAIVNRADVTTASTADTAIAVTVCVD
jgi:subtilisin family serine protease